MVATGSIDIFADDYRAIERADTDIHPKVGQVGRKDDVGELAYVEGGRAGDDRLGKAVRQSALVVKDVREHQRREFTLGIHVQAAQAVCPYQRK